MTSHLQITSPAELRANTVALRPISYWDIPEILLAHQSDPELARALGLQRPPTAAQLGGEIDTAGAGWAAGILRFTVLTPESNDCRGRLIINAADAAAGIADGIIWIAPGW